MSSQAPAGAFQPKSNGSSTQSLQQDYGAIIARLRSTFRSGKTKPYAWRRRQLDQLMKLLTEREHDIVRVLAEDSGKPELEAYTGEVAFVRAEAKHMRKHLKKWMKRKRVGTPPVLLPARSHLRYEPMGVVLIMGAWNYPVHEILGPLAGALAAGNCVVLKPSELSPAASAFIAEVIPKYFDDDSVVVCEGGVAETTELLKQRFDKILFTGSARIGKIVMRAAAEHLTPVILEMGGKSPAIVDRSARMAVIARRILWGKFFHAGQTCLAPDYVLVHEDDRDALITEMKKALDKFYSGNPKTSPDYSRIINKHHFERLVGFLGDGQVVYGGEFDAEDKYIAPTMMVDVSWDAPVMQEEIFGPVLPILTYRSLDECIERINDRPTPLGAYVFSENNTTIDYLLDRIESGGAAVNQIMAQASNPELPFGGKGESGMGAYHGHESFLCFSHRRGVVHQSLKIDSPLAYPPYSENTKKWIRRLLG